MEAKTLKILICYALDAIPEPLTREELCGALSEQDGAFFSLSAALDELAREGYVNETEQGFTVTDLGRRFALPSYWRLPATECDAAAGRLMRLVALKRSRAENPCTISQNPDGSFTVDLCVLDGNDVLMRLSLLTYDINHANAIGERFEQKPGEIYNGVLDLLS